VEQEVEGDSVVESGGRTLAEYYIGLQQEKGRPPVCRCEKRKIDVAMPPKTCEKSDRHKPD